MSGIVTPMEIQIDQNRVNVNLIDQEILSLGREIADELVKLLPNRICDAENDRKEGQWR